MITTADLTGYGAIIEAVERLLDALPVDAVLLRHDKEIVASNESAAEKGLVQGVKCHEGWLNIDRPCPWCHAKKALSSGRPLDHMVRAKADENGEMVVVEEGGIIMDAHWYPIAPDLYHPLRRDLSRGAGAAREDISRDREVPRRADAGGFDSIDRVDPVDRRCGGRTRQVQPRLKRQAGWEGKPSSPVCRSRSRRRPAQRAPCGGRSGGEVAQDPRSISLIQIA